MSDLRINTLYFFIALHVRDPSVVAIMKITVQYAQTREVMNQNLRGGIILISDVLNFITEQLTIYR